MDEADFITHLTLDRVTLLGLAVRPEYIVLYNLGACLLDHVYIVIQDCILDETSLVLRKGMLFHFVNDCDKCIEIILR